MPEGLETTLNRDIPKLKDSEPNSFAQGIGEPPFNISGDTARDILWKAVGTICAHAGYDVGTDAILDTLTDIVQDYMAHICQTLSYHAYSKPHPEPTVFPDAIERTCHDLGIKSMFKLNDFYQLRVIKYHNNLLHECYQLKHDYESLSQIETQHQQEETGEEGQESRITSEISEEDDDPQLPTDPIPMEDLQGVFQNTTLEDSSMLQGNESMKILFSDEEIDDMRYSPKPSTSGASGSSQFHLNLPDPDPTAPGHKHKLQSRKRTP